MGGGGRGGGAHERSFLRGVIFIGLVVGVWGLGMEVGRVFDGGLGGEDLVICHGKVGEWFSFLLSEGEGGGCGCFYFYLGFCIFLFLFLFLLWCCNSTDGGIDGGLVGIFLRMERFLFREGGHTIEFD